MENVDDPIGDISSYPIIAYSFDYFIVSFSGTRASATGLTRPLCHKLFVIRRCSNGWIEQPSGSKL